MDDKKNSHHVTEDLAAKPQHEMASPFDEEPVISSAPAPTPAAPTQEDVGAPSWLGRPIVNHGHADDLETAAAVNEYGLKMPRDKAEEAAYGDYVKAQRQQAAAHHLLGMKVAHAAGDMETARKHSLMYKLHSMALGHEPVGPVPAAVANERPLYKFKFRPHHGDLFALDKRGPEGPVKAKEPGADRSQKTVSGEIKVPDPEPMMGTGKLPVKAKVPAPAAKAKGQGVPTLNDVLLGKAEEEMLRTIYVAAQALVKGEVVGKIGNEKGAEPQPKHKRKFDDVGIQRATKQLRADGYEPHPKAPKIGSYFDQKPKAKKSELAEWAKSELSARKTKVKPCVCPSYAFPHRHKSGKCGGK